jgi:hypothetical protein
MFDWLTVLELTAAAVVAIGALYVIAQFVNQARAKASATDSGKTRTVAQPNPVSVPEPRKTTPPAAVAPPRAAVVTPPAADASSESLLPPLEPIPLVSNAPLPPPPVEPSEPANKIVSVRFPRFAKPRAVPTARLKNAVRLKTSRASKVKRRTRSGHAASGQRILLAPVAKAKPVLTRRPKRVMQIRRKKITGPVRRSGKAVADRSSRPVLTPA